MIAIHNGISDIPKDYKKNEFSKDELKIVMISRFCPQKDPYTLINAVAEANKEGCNIKLDLYGYGQELEKVKDCINSQNDSNIRYVGEISDVTPILKNYDVYALISNWEGLPIGIIEAMRAGLPILVSDVGGNAECIRENGYLVKRGNIEYCKIRLKQFWNNINRLPEMGKNSRNFYEEEFIVEKMVRNTLILFEE
jgi:glycosyltransferase involved in cell wall biosynthesis